MDWFRRDSTVPNLLVAARSGDREAFERLVRGCRSFTAVCAKLTGDPEEAEDLQLDTLYRALRGIGSFSGSTQAQFARWLNRIAANAFRDRIHARRPVASLDDPLLPDPTDPSPTPAETTTEADFWRHLTRTAREELRGLGAGADLWRCLALRLEGWSHEEIASALGGTAKEWKDRYSETVTPALARVRLRFAFAAGGPIPGWTHADYELYRRRAETGEDYATIARSMKRKEEGLRRRWREAIVPVIERDALVETALSSSGRAWPPDDAVLLRHRMLSGREYGEPDGTGPGPYGDDPALQREAWSARIGPALASVACRKGRSG